MHICLLPTEILLRIFTINHSKDLNHISRVTLAALARTCRKFKEPALDILWKDINGFEPLISCLPESITHTNAQGYLTLKRPLYYGEWELIDRYTRRIDSFTVVSIELDMIDIRVAQALMSAPSPTPLLPNLRILRWYDDREHLFPLLRNFLASSITTMRLGFRSTPLSFAQSALLVSLGARCPSIQQLRCAGVGDSEESSDAICEALCDLQELFCLETGVLNPRVLLRLTSLPSLKYLQFRLETYNINEMQLDSPTIFSRLERVHITVQSQSVINNCLRNVRFPSCRSGKAYVIHDDDLEVVHYPLDIPDLIITLSECFSPALQKLHFEFGFDFSALTQDTLANPSSALGFNAIAPLLSFSRLTDLKLDWICTSAINDASLKTIAQSLPQLEVFFFGGSGRWLIPPSLTLIGLVHIIQHCRQMRIIQLSFHAFPVLFDTDPFFFETVPNMKITKLFVGMSPISGDYDAVADTLLKLMPKLYKVLFVRWFIDNVPPALPPFEHLEDGWNSVNAVLRCHWSKMREGMDMRRYYIR